MAEARFAGAFTFQYSPRPGTPAAAMAGQVPREVVQERYERLVALQDALSLAANRALVGSTVEVLVAEGEGRKDAATGRRSGRARDGRLVHFACSPDEVRPGDVVTTAVTYGAPHHLVADGPPLSHRRTRGRGRVRGRPAAGDARRAARDADGPRPEKSVGAASLRSRHDDTHRTPVPSCRRPGTERELLDAFLEFHREPPCSGSAPG